jgi:hypothetical protein
LQDFVGLFPALDLGVCHEGSDASLKGAKTPFYLAFGLRSGGNQMSNSKGSSAGWNSLFGSLQSLLELEPKRLRPSV